MKIMKIKPGILALMSVALIWSLRLHAETNVVFFDPFTGAAGTGINFTAPQDHGGIGVDVWTGPETGLVRNGTALEATEGPRNAYLPFFPADGNKYRLSADMHTTHTGDDWFAIGFADTMATIQWFPAGNSTGWFLLRGSNATAQVHTFIGPQLVGGDGVGFYSGPHNLAVVLNTMAANWTFEYFIDGVSVRGPVAYSDTPDVNPLIYYVGVGSYTLARGTMDNFKVEIIEHIDLTIPSVLQPPQDATVVIGGLATFSVTASGEKPLTYQWFKNDTVQLSGEINATLTVSNLTFADNGTKYSVKVSNASGNATSSNATLTVLNVAGPLLHKFNFNEGTANDSVGGVTGTLNGSATVRGGLLLEDGTQTGFVDLGYYPMPPYGNATIVAWFKASSSVGLRSRLFGFGSGILNYINFSPRQGAPETARLAMKTGTDAEAFVDISPALNDNLNHQVAAVIDSTPTLTGLNGTMSLYIDGNLAGSADLNGTTALANLASGPKNFLGKALFIDSDSYYKGSIDEVRVFNTALSQSEIAALVPDTNPDTAPEIIEQPVGITAFVGGPAKFSITVIGSQPVYHWFFNGTTPVGGNTNVLLIDPVKTNSFGSYSVIVSNNLGAATSAVVQLDQTFWTFAPWNDDATSGVDTNYLYTHAYSFASDVSTDINGVRFTGVTGANPSVTGTFSFTVTGEPNVFNNDANNVTGGSQVLATDFIYGGAPGTLTLNGLTPGKQYVLTLYSVAFDAKGVRPILFTGPTGPGLVVDQDYYDNNNGIRISYEYTADANGSVTVTNNQTIATYAFHWYGFCNRTLEKLPPASPPQITTQPQSAAVDIDSTATFSVTAVGSQLQYQWFLNDTSITGATAADYTIANVQSKDFGAYKVVVSNPYGTVTNAVVRLVQLRWHYDAWSDDATSGVDTQYLYTHAYTFGGSVNTDINGVTFTAVPGSNPSVYPNPGPFFVTGIGTVYNNDGNNVTGASQVMANDFVYGGSPGTLTLTGLTPGQSYLLTLYSVAFDAPGVRKIRFSAADDQVVVIDQDTYDNNNGIRINFKYTADANGSVTVTNSPLAAGSTFHCYGFCNRLFDALPTTARPEILSQPQSAAVAMGAQASLSVTAGGPGELHYQWFLNGSSINGATDTNYTIASVASIQLGNYTVVVNNANGAVTSVVAQVLLSRWSYANWTDDASSGVDSQYVYTHAYNFGSANNAVINGITFNGIAGANPSVSNVFKLTGVGSVFNNDANNITNSTGGSRTMANDFIYGGAPGTLTLSGLVPGRSYLLTLYSVGWEAPGGRLIRFSAADNQVVTFDQDTYDNNNGIRISYEYVADTNGSVTVASIHTVGGATFHTYGFSNRETSQQAVELQFTRGTAGSIVFAWPESYSGYTLKYTTTLGTGASWQTEPTTPVQADGFYKVTITPSGAMSFYRLQK